MLQIEEVIEQLNYLFSISDYENAEKIVVSAREIPALYNDVVAIFDANLSLNRGDYSQMWEAIRRGLEYNPKNYELYVLLGEYYLQTNLNQAYLCFENALFYCDNDDDRVQIQAYMEGLMEQEEITVNKVSFIILSYNTLDFTKTCIESIRENTLESSREIVIVDNASTDGSLEWLKEQKDIVLRANTENSGFPKGCNQGVEVASKENDVFLLNSDTLVPPNALFWLRMGLYENDSIGATGSITNFAANFQAIPFEDSSTENLLKYAYANNIPQKYPYEEKLHLIGFALLIKRSVYDKVGDLDERFSPGNFEDNDYGVRVIKAGYKNILCRNSFILHFGSKSFGKKAEKYAKLLETNAKKFEEKWKLNVSVHFNPQQHLIRFIEESIEENIRILDVGCACGATCAYIKSQYQNAEVYGVEINKEAADIAAHIADVVCADIENMNYPWEEGFFDYILFSDVLEYLNTPEEVIRNLAKYVKKDGHIIVSMPNTKDYLEMFVQAADGVFPLDKQVRYTGANKYIIKAKKEERITNFTKKIAVCVPTYNHPDVVDDVLKNSINDYYDCGIDIYYYDSSEGNETELIVKRYQDAGFDNLYYLRIPSEMRGEDKMLQIFSNKGLQKEYDYIWPVKDRVYCPKVTLESICESAEEDYELIFLGVLNTANGIEISTTTYEDPIAFYRDWGWLTTSWDVTIYNQKKMLNDFNMIRFKERHTEKFFYVFTYIFEVLVQKESFKIRLLRDNRTGIYNSPLGNSGAMKRPFEIWQGCWIKVNKALPKCYNPYKAKVIKETGNLPWIFGSVSVLMKLRKNGLLTLETYDIIKEDWHRVSDIPLETVYAIATNTYDVTHDAKILKNSNDEMIPLLIRCISMIEENVLPKEKIPFDSIEEYISDQLIRNGKISQEAYYILCGSIFDIRRFILNEARSTKDILSAMQMYISYIIALTS